VRTPLLLGLGALALVGVLMLGGWALTSATPQVPRHVPAARSAAGARGDASAPAADDRARAGGAPRPDPVHARARDARTQPARPGSPPPGAAAPAPAPVAVAGAAHRTSAPSQPLRREPDSDAGAVRRAEAARQLADRLRAEQLRQAERARQAEAAKRADDAGRAAERAQDDGDAGE
jgi:hypothetical protein